MNTATGALCDRDPREVKGGILADAMGLGKSLTILALLATDWPCKSKGLGPTLLIVPPSLLRTWEEELKKHVKTNSCSYLKYHGPKRSNNIATILNYDIVLTTYDVVTLEWRDFMRSFDLGPKPLYSCIWHRIVLDEGRLDLELSQRKRELTYGAQPMRSDLIQRTVPELSALYEDVYGGLLLELQSRIVGKISPAYSTFSMYIRDMILNPSRVCLDSTQLTRIFGACLLQFASGDPRMQYSYRVEQIK